MQYSFIICGGLTLQYEITTEIILGKPYDLVVVEHCYKIGDIVERLPDGLYRREGDGLVQICKPEDMQEIN